MPVLRTSILVTCIALAGCGPVWFSKPKYVPVSVDNILTFTLPDSFTSQGNVRQNMHRAIYRFIEHKQNDWGGYPHYPVVLHVTIFNPDIPPGERQPILEDAFRFFAEDLQVGDPVKVGWTESTGSLKLGPVGYKKNLTEEPSWVITALGNGFAIDFYAWEKKYSAKKAKALVEQVASSVQLKNLPLYWEEIADQPRRAREAREAKLAKIKQLLAAAGWPAPEPAGKVIEHEGFVYAAAADRESFGIGLKLGELNTAAAKPNPRVDFILAQEEKERLPNLWYFPEEGKWQVLDHDASWIPTKELLATLESKLDRNSIHFYAMRGFAFEYTDIGDFDVTVFAKDARRLRELFRAGNVAKLR